MRTTLLKRLPVIALAVLLVGATACSSNGVQGNVPQGNTDTTVKITKAPTVPVVAPTIITVQSDPNRPAGPPDDADWVMSAVYYIPDYFPGAVSHWTIQIHNGQEDLREDTKNAGTISSLGGILAESPVKLKLGDNVVKVAGVGTLLLSIPKGYEGYASSGRSCLVSSGVDVNGAPVTNVPVYLDEDVKVLTTVGEPGDISVGMAVVNQQSYTAYVRQPNKTFVSDSTGLSYPPASEKVSRWVSIEPVDFIVLPRTTAEVDVTLAMPSDAKPPADSWSFWVALHRNESTFVQQEPATWTLVSMRQ